MSSNFGKDVGKWLSLARNLGFSGHELRVIERIIRDNQQDLLEAWDGWFGN